MQLSSFTMNMEVVVRQPYWMKPMRTTFGTKLLKDLLEEDLGSIKAMLTI